MVKPKTATMTPKKAKTLDLFIFVLRKKSKDEANLQFYNDMICASVEAFFCCSCLLQFASVEAFILLLLPTHAHIDERGREYWRERERERDENLAKSEIGKVENYQVQNYCWKVKTKCVDAGTYLGEAQGGLATLAQKKFWAHRPKKKKKFFILVIFFYF